jgi:NADH-quinone oxidoreductase subunit L
MEVLEILSVLVVFAPLFGAVLVGLNTRGISNSLAQFITTSLVVMAAIFASYIFYNVAIVGDLINIKLMPWFESGGFKADWAIYVDVLTAVMLVVVTWVSSLVHIYSVGYMHDDPHRPRFMCYLSLFTFCMLMLVVSDNLVQMFFGWEGVGLSSYLLIGFWFKKKSANSAAIKAFLVNRVGDIGFALGIFMAFWVFGSVNFTDIFGSVEQHVGTQIKIFGYDCSVVTIICLLLFIGAMGKSAQIGLHTWLPDAMEGPTPVSALIHAATMVTAGVFMVARCSPIYEYSPFALSVITVIGAVTCIFAASVALVQNDIKRIIAYSTCSQLGYMFFACGVSAYAAGIFHLMTHAFFKALLFLGAGSVIHAMSGEQDIRKMGGIWRKLPYTYSMMWIGSLALAGIYPLAGFFSKDIILEAAYVGSDTGRIAYWVGLVAAVLTAFYSWRLIILTFHGSPKASAETMAHVHESPLSMSLPLLILAMGAIGAGFIGDKVLNMVDGEGGFWRGAIFVAAEEPTLAVAHHVEPWVAYMPLFAGILGILLAYFLYMLQIERPEQIARIFRRLYIFLQHKWYFDELYHAVFVKPAKYLGTALWKHIDVEGVDGIPNGLAVNSSRLAKFVSFVQSGYIYHYALTMMLGLLGILFWSLYLLK